MKICILSMQHVLNYGSLLQAYSLMKILKEIGHEVSFLEIEPNSAENSLLGPKKNFPESSDISKRSIFYRVLQQDTNPFYIIPKIAAKKATVRKMQEFQRNVLGLKSESNGAHYDCCVIGSDEVFNCMQDCAWGFTSQLFGNVKQADKVVTYAASCGFTKAEDIPEEMSEVIKNSLHTLSAVSVRDANTAKFIEYFDIPEYSMNSDPVAIGNFAGEISEAGNVVKKLPKKYCVIYAYNDRIHSEDEINAIISFCKKHHMTPVSVGGSQKWVHHHLALNPFEVLAVFQNAEFVITDTFHGTIFSAKYAKRFAVIVRESNANKLEDLLQKLHINDHKLKSINELEECFSQLHDKAIIQGISTEEYQKALSYLEENL